MLRRIGNREIVVPLSGGLDSRTIVYYLKKLGCKNVICLSYGRKSSFEVKISKQVAERLGYKWILCEYTAQKWKDLYSSADYNNFLLFSGHGSEIGCIQALAWLQ